MFKRAKEFLKATQMDLKEVEPPAPADPITGVLMDDLVYLRAQFGVSADLTIRRLNVCGHEAAVVTLEGMIDRHMMADAVILPITSITGSYTPQALLDHIRDDVLGYADMLQVCTMEELINLVASGFGAILVDGVPFAVLGGLQAFMIRGVSEPSTEVTVRGSREGFTEAIRVNISMIRRRLKTPELVFDMMEAGKTSHTAVCLCYMKSRVSEEQLAHVKEKIESLPLDAVLESGYIQPFLESPPRGLFSGVNTTERPDTLCGKILEGRIGVLVDGTPFVLVIPYLFVENFQSMDDYALNPYYASFLRIIKYAAFFVSLFLPGLYVAVGTYHPEMLPPTLLMTFLKADHATPFPLTVEALLIHFLFEIMREAGLRLPRPVGHAVSIIGALVIGDAAVTAGIIGSSMVMVVALTALSSFVVPSLYEPAAVLKFVFIVVGGTWGLFGISVGFMLLLTNLCALESFGIPVMAPTSPTAVADMRDNFWRSSWKKLGRFRLKVQNLPGSRLKKEEK